MKYEIRVNGGWHEVTCYVWRSYAGERRVDGRPWHGPVFKLGTHEIVRRSTYLPRRKAA